jgi:succinate-acetate transporter protein
MGFGMTTILLNFHNAGFFPLSSMILAMGIFYGGLAQIIAGIMEWKKGNTFAATAFTSYGMFWLSLVTLIVLPNTGLGIAAAGKDFAMPAYLAMWAIFTAVLFIATLRLNRALQVVFGSLTVLFVLLALGDATNSETITKIAGWVGLFCGASAVYAALAQVLNEVYGKTVWPIGPVAKK